MHITLTELTAGLIVPARNIMTQSEAPFSMQEAILWNERQIRRHRE